MTKDEMLAEVKQLIADNTIMVFLKGTADAPQCGFSHQTAEVMRQVGKPFGDKNVLSLPDYRYVLSAHSNWPTIPQVFINGEFVGGCDIVTQLYQSGELQKKVDEAFAGASA